MKKIIALLLVLFVLVGCGGSKDTESTAWKFTSENVRKAMSYAIDREALVASVNDGSVAAKGIIPISLASNPVTGADFRDDAEVQVSYDLDKAKEYFAAACEELGVKSISIDLLYGTNEGDSVIKAAEQIAYYLEEAGFDVNLVQKQKKERLAMAKEGDFEVMLTRWGPDYGDPQTYADLYVSDNFNNNYGHYNSAEYDKLVAEAEDALDPTVRWEKFIEAEKVLVSQDMGIVPVFQAGNAMIIRPGVSGIEFHSASVDVYRNITGKDTVTVTAATDVLSWDSCVATDGTSFIAQIMMVSGLTKLDENGNVLLDLAESYDVSEDGTVYTFKIKDGAKWSNGTDVTADDFVFAWNRLVNPDTASEYDWWLETLSIDSYQALDAKTLEVTLSRPSGIFLQGLAFPSAFPINEAFFTECGDLFATDAEHLLACGPYVLDSWTPGYGYEFSKNADYVDAAAYAASANKVVFRVLEDTQTALMEYQQGLVDTVTLAGEQVSANKDVDGFMQKLQGYLFYLQINIDNNVQ